MQWRNFFHQLQQRVLFQIHAQGRHGTHSPLVYDLVDQHLLIQPDKTTLCIEEHRNVLLSSNATYSPTDHGVGSRISTSRLLADSVKYASSSKAKCQFLFAFTQFVKPRTVIELGTHVGIGTAYMQAASPKAHVFTLEGDPFLAEQARTFFQLYFPEIVQVEGPFLESLPHVLSSVPSWDLVWLDGHHAMEPTLNYWHILKPFASQQAWLLVDDIHWSSEMTRAWKLLKTQPEVNLALEFKDWGALYLGPRNQYESFVLKY
jgi:predicted O-methyltransferase YrrM